MYFYELLKKCDFNIITERFIEQYELYKIDFDRNEIPKKVEQVIIRLKEINPIINNRWVIYVKKVNDKDDSTELFDVTVFGEEDIPYSISATPWNEVLGYIVDAESIKKYEINDLISAILWEMTYWGYDER